LFWVIGCVDCVSEAEQQLTPAGDVLFWNQIIKADQFILSSLGPVTRWFNSPRNLFAFRCAHFERPITTIRASGVEAEVAFRLGYL